jgi:ArsR family transcriptional regulator
MNISNQRPPKTTSGDPARVAELFRLLAQPARLRILLAIGAGETCVCHLETLLGLRQASISQQLMLLRDAGLVSANREGRNIYYRLSNPRLLELIAGAAHQLGMALPTQTPCDAESLPLPGCPCPHCAEAAGVAPEQARQIDCDPPGTKKEKRGAC